MHELEKIVFIDIVRNMVIINVSTDVKAMK